MIYCVLAIISPVQFQPDLNVPDVPKAMAWCNDALCVGFKRDYFLINVCML